MLVVHVINYEGLTLVRSKRFSAEALTTNSSKLMT
jgi:hypothetical protein